MDDPDLADAHGELANTVAEQAKSKIAELNISISLPKVVAGDSRRILKSGHTSVLVLPCDCPIGGFAVEVAMVKEQAANSACFGVCRGPLESPAS